MTENIINSFQPHNGMEHIKFPYYLYVLIYLSSVVVFVHLNVAVVNLGT
jgi:hypothetical protein